MKHLTLFELTDEIICLVDDIVDAIITGETVLVDTLIDELTNLYEVRDEKHESYVHVIKNAESAAESCRREANGFYARSKALNGLASRLKDRLMGDLQLHGETSTTAGKFKIARQKNSQPSVILNIDASALPTDYQRITIDADKDALKDALKNGAEVDGVELVTGEHVRIRVK